MALAKHGFTLAELTIGVAITSLVGLSVAGLSFGLSNAYESNDNYYQSLQTARSAMRAVQSALRKSKLVVGTTETDLLLWVNDEDESDTINASELLLLRWDNSSGELREHRIDLDALSDFDRALFDVEVALNTTVISPQSVTSWMRNHIYAQSRVLAEEITNFQATGQSAAPMTRLLKINISSGAAGNEVALRSVVKIRADATDQVSMVGGAYFLDGE